MPAFLTLFGANRLTVGVLTDSSVASSATITELRKAGKLYAGGLVQIGDSLQRDEADVEDLFDTKTYLDLVNAAYAGALVGQVISPSDLAGTDRVVKDVAAHFKKQNINAGKFNHFAPAGALMRSRARAKASKGELSRAETLFTTINRLLVPQPT